MLRVVTRVKVSAIRTTNDALGVSIWSKSLQTNRYAFTTSAFQLNGQAATGVQSEETVNVCGKDFAKDEWTNVTPNILSKTSRKLHLHPSHPISIIRQRIESHFSTFEALNKFEPTVTTKMNFDDLCIPADHPTRVKSDNYYINATNMLRAHTSAHQLQGLLSGATKFLISGDVYRRDEIDSSHYPVFHQMEGLQYFDMHPEITGKQIQDDIASQEKLAADTVQLMDDTIIKPENPIQHRHPPEAVQPVIAHLKHSLNSMVRALFKDEPNLQVRWIDAYFPFTSPSWEMEIYYQGEWLEILGCGIVRQDLMDAAGLHDKIGWAFGCGLERLAMVLFSIPDIRLFWSEDERFLNQFASGEIVKFQPFSKYPPCLKDISFWLPENEWNENNFSEIVRGVAGDIVENVKKVT
ncbi:phenylalanyl-tRNA synthetase [Umbelopsis sp. PMI_123]|nr:phenylalanyl-tRNA synthetase [Umbelopsis sp. PMI_123]